MKPGDLPFCFWQSETVLGTFLEHNLTDLSLNSLNTGRALIFWGDGKYSRMLSSQYYATTNSNVYPQLEEPSERYLVQFTPQQKITWMTVTTEYISGYASTYRTTAHLENCSNLQSLVFSNIPLTDVNFDGVKKLQYLNILYSYGLDPLVYRLQNINIDNAISLQNLTLQYTDVTTIDFTNNNYLYELDCYYNPLNSITFNITGNNSLTNMYVEGNNLSIDTTKCTNLENLQITGTIPSLDLSPLTNLKVFSLFSSSTLPISSIFHSIPVPASEEERNSNLYIQFKDQASTSDEDALDLGPQWGNIYGLNIDGSQISHINTQMASEIPGTTYNALYNTRFISLSYSTLSSEFVSEIIIGADRGSFTESYSGLLNLGDKSYDATWSDPFGYLGTITTSDSLKALAERNWIISSDDPYVYLNDIGASYYHAFFTFNFYFSSYSIDDFIINGVTNPAEPIDSETGMTTSVIVGESYPKTKIYRLDTNHSTNNLLLSTENQLIIPIASYNVSDPNTVGSNPTTFNIWIDSSGYSASQGAVEGDIKLAFNNGVNITSIFPTQNTRSFTNDTYISSKFNQISWSIIEVIEGVHTVISNDIYTGQDYSETSEVNIPFSDPYISDVNSAPDGFRYLQISVY